MQIVFTLLLFLFIPLTFAGNEVGNGGDIIVCHNQPHTLLDYFEAEKHYNLSLLQVKESSNIYKIADDRLKQLEKFNPVLAKKLRSLLKELPQEMRLVKNFELTNISDSMELGVPKHCQLKQIAIQRLNIKTKKNEIIIDHELWASLAQGQKIGLVLHELLYKYFSFFKIKDSKEIRMFNGLLSSKQFLNYSKKEYQAFANKTSLPLY